MNNVTVEKIHNTSEPLPLPAETIQMLDAIPRRAFELFKQRGGVSGDDLGDWLRAERELFRVPDTELAEEDGNYRVQIAVPGFDAKEIHVAALPDSLIVEGESSHRHDGTSGTLHFCEFGDRQVFRRIPLPEPVDVDHVSATLDKGVLQIRAAKAGQNRSRKATG